MTYRSDHFTALLDACVLAGVLKRNLLLSLAEAELFRPRWSAERAIIAALVNTSPIWGIALGVLGVSVVKRSADKKLT